MYAYSQYLKVENNFLLGKKNFWSKWQKVDVCNIQKVIVHGPFNPYIEVITTNGKFFVGALCKQYETVADFLNRYTKYSVKENTKHKLNNVICKNKYHVHVKKD